MLRRLYGVSRGMLLCSMPPSRKRNGLSRSFSCSCFLLSVQRSVPAAQTLVKLWFSSVSVKTVLISCC